MDVLTVEGEERKS